MANVKRINTQVWEYLSNFEQEQWLRSRFSKWPKVDNLTSNNCESFNSQLWFKFYIMKTIATNKDALMAYIEKLAPVQISRLEKEKRQANYWEAQWQLTGLPYCHGIAVIQRKNEKPENYVYHKLIIEAYDRTCQFHINSIPSQEYWKQHEELPCIPPPYKRPIDRPTKKKAKDITEQCFRSQYNAKKRYGKITCQTCNRVGHNSRTCPEKLTEIAIAMQDIDEEEAREKEVN
ncbi:hypothetical protein Ahy_B03g063353 isoform B [Arachis hypogaea]|uniref:CCHC-type domain-containing protein n=1 Tax=Arachis hypogaea TaxID=3818 RepID=A0A444ZX44_ARAHY|nr:hypothetical protein Ahy_B03g063353 isoform B [Arachis hypogaea]